MRVKGTLTDTKPRQVTIRSVSAGHRYVTDLWTRSSAWLWQSRTNHAGQAGTAVSAWELTMAESRAVPGDARQLWHTPPWAQSCSGGDLPGPGAGDQRAKVGGPLPDFRLAERQRDGVARAGQGQIDQRCDQPAVGELRDRVGAREIAALQNAEPRLTGYLNHGRG